MSEEEIALKLVSYEFKDITVSNSDVYIDRYFFYLEKIKNHDFENKKDKIQNQLDRYHKIENITAFELFEILDKIQEIVGE